MLAVRQHSPGTFSWLASLPCSAIKDLLILLAHLLVTIARLLGPGGTKTIVADSLSMKQQPLIMNRTRRRAPNLLVMTFLGHTKDRLWRFDLFSVRIHLTDRATGYSQSWISLRTTSSDLESMAAMSMGPPSGVCSTQPTRPEVHRNS